MPTILELKQEEWMPYVRAKIQNSSLLAPNTESEAKRRTLLQQAQKVAWQLHRQFPLRRVIAFGSLAHAAWFMPDSDIDLAVEGLPPEAFWAAWKIAEEAFPGYRVDLIDIDSAGESLRHAIDKGIEL